MKNDALVGLSKYMTTAKIAEVFGINRRTTIQLIEAGHVIGAPILGRWKVETRSIVKYFKSRETAKGAKNV